MSKQNDILKIKSEFENELFDSIIPFWERYSIDSKNGGPYKGFFHIPRALFYSINIFDKLLKQNDK